MPTPPLSSGNPERTKDRIERDDPCGLRCMCGSLLARLVDDHVELKCKRCKRKVLVPLQGVGTRPTPLGADAE